MNNISVTPKGGTIASELSGNQVNLTAPSVVKLHLNQSDIKSFTRNGNDLVVTTKSGEVVVIHGFYSPNGDSDLVLQDDRGAMWWVEDPGTEGFQYVSIDSTEGLLAENTTNDGTIAAFGIGGAALAGIGALFAGSGGGGGNASPGDNGGNPTNPTDPDTTPPAVVSDVVVTDAVGPYQGTISAGGITDDNTPTLSGTAEAGAIIRIYDGNTLIGSVTAGADGSWSFTTPTLTDGQHSLSVTATDAAGNTSAASNPVGFTVDTVAPDAVAGLTVVNNSGSTALPITNGGATNDTTPQLSGTAEAGSIITIRDGNTVLGSVTVGSNGAWSFTSPALSQGSHTLSITATDAAGNSSTPTTITFTVDTQAPAAATELSLSDNSGNNSGNVPNGSSTDDNTPTLSGRGEAGAVVSVYDGLTLLGTAVVGANGSWSFTTPTLSNGSHSLTVTLTDAAGNVSPASPAYEVNVQAGIPPATTSFEITDDTGSTLVQLSNGASTHDNTPTLSGLATAGALITLYNGTTVLGSVVAGSDGQWTFTPGTLADGSYALHASVTDTGGNVTQTPTISITIDTVAPAAAGGIQLSDNDGSTLQPIASGGATNTTTPVLSGTAEPGSTVTVRDGSTVLGTATVGSNGTWSFTSPTLTEGNHSLTTTVTDAAGNVGPGSSPITFTVDTQAPTVASNVVISDNVGSTTGPITAGGTTDDNTPTLTGNGEANAIVKIYDGTTLIGSVTVGTNGSWSFTTPTLSNGSHSLSVTLTDAAGNVSPATTGVGFTVNAGVPPTTSTLEITDDSGSTLKVLPEGSSTQDTTPTLSGLAAANAVVELYNGTTLLGSTVAGADGQWSFTPAALADGTYAFHVVATDTSGNVTNSGTINITVDTVVPDAASGVALTNDAGSITQPVTSGNAINDATPVLSGSAEAGSTVTILDGTTVLGTVTVGSDGNWSFTTPTLAEGSHSLTTTVTDAAGNVSPATAPIAFSVDTVAPAATSGLVVTDNVGSSTGPLTSGTITDDSTPTLSGTAEAGAVVRVYDGTTLLGSATVGSNGSWSFTPDAALTNGQHSLTTTVTDAAGNVSPSSPVFTLNVDAGVPATNSLLIVSDDSGSTLVELPNNSSTNDTTPILSGQASEGDLITLYNGTTIIGSVVAGTDGQWNFTPAALADGNYAFHATATNPTTGVETDTPTINITIDTVVPTAPADVALTNDAGDPIPAGSSTNDNTPTLSGTGEAGGTVTVSDGTTVLGTTTVGNDGNWSYTTPPLSDGNHSLTSTVTDPAGNTGPASPPVTVTIDTQPPAAAGNVQFSNDDGTPIAAGGTTNDTTPTLSGTAEPGSTVTVSDGTTELGTATTGSDGNWSFTPTEPLSEGQHNLSTTVTDPAGNVGPASSVVIVIVDTTAPAVASDLQLSNDGSGTLVPIADGGTTNDLTPVLSGRAEPGSIVTILDGTSVLGSVAVGNDGNWSFTSPALDPGAHSLTTTVTDAAGNTGAASTPLTFTLDVTTPPAPGGVQLSNDTSGTPVPINSGAATNDATPVLSGTAAEGSTITVSDGGTVLGTVTVGSGGEWSFTTPALNEGNHSLTATVTSPAGNTSAPSTPIVVTVDITPPAAATGLQLSNNDGATPLPIAAGGTTNDTTPALSGTAEAGSIVTVRDGTDIIGSATVGSDGSWSVTPSQPLAAGEHTLTATVTDPAGNVGPTSTPITVNIDTTQPPAAGDVALNNDNGGTPVPITSGGATNDTTPVISGTAAAGSTVTVLDGTTVLGTVTVGSGGTWSFTTPALSEGAHSLTTTVTSPAGNVSDPSTAIAFTVDTQPPATSTDLQLSNDGGTTIAAGGITNDNTPILRGTAEAGSTVTVRDGTTVLGTATADTDGNWSFTPATALGEGAHSLTTTVTDPAGNSSGASTPIAFTVDTTPPAAATDLQLSNDSSGTALPIDTGGRTNDTTPVLSGSAEAGSVVTVSDNGAVLGSTTVGTDGKWSFTPTTPLDAGAHSLTTTVTDTAGNVGPASPAVTVTIDTEAPPAATDVELNNDQGNTPAPIASGGATNDTTPVLSGNADPDSIVVVRDGTTVLGTVIVGTDGAWSFTTPALSQGEHSLTATVTDAAGNSSAPSTAITFTVDTEAPSAATGLQLSNDSGGTAVPIAVGGSTNDTTPVLSGSAEAGSTVTISDGSNVLGSVVVGSSGNWSFTSTVLGEGPHSLTTTVTDPAGNVSAPSAALNFSIDTTPPAAPDALELSNNNGSTPVAIDGNSTTNDATPLLSGTAEAGSTVTVRDGTQVLGSAIVGSNGQWSFTTPTLGEGGHSLTATVTDPAGNVGPASSAIAFTVDTVAPVAATGLELNNNNGGTPVPIANNGTTNDSTPLLSGTAEANSIVIVSDGTTVLGSAIANAQGDWSFSPTLTDGTHNLSVTVRDAAGNTSPASSAITVTVDTVAPPAATGLTLTNDIGTPVTIPNGGLTNDNTPVLSGSGLAGSIITIADQNGVLGSTTVGAGGTWSFTPQTALADGTHTFSVTASDAAGNVSAPATIGVVIDATPPAVAGNIVASNDEGTSPVAITNGGATNDNTPFLTGTAEAGSTIIIRDGTEILGSASVGSNGQWSFSSPQLDDGEHSLTTTVVDAAGNVGPASTAIDFTVDTTVPTPATLVVSNDNSGAPVLVPNGASTSDNTPLLSGAAEAGSLVTIYDGNVVIGSTTALGDGSWSFSSPVLTDGSHTLTATVTDEVGNVSAPSASFTVVVDVTPPQPADDLLLQNNNGGTPITIADGGITNDSTPAISGTAEANAVVRVYDGTTLVGSAIAGSNGAWSITTTALSNATHTLNVSVTDAAGNVSSNASVSLTVDTSTPAQVLSFAVYNDANTTPVQVANEGDTNDNTPVISGTGVAGTTINVYEGPTLLGTTTVGDNGTWSFQTTTLSDGQHSFTVSVTNAAGTTGPEATPITVYIDTSVPDPITLADLTVNDNVGGSTGPLTNGVTTDDNTPTFSGTAEAGSRISIYDGTTLLGTVNAVGGNWSYTPGTGLSNGGHSFTFTVTDAAGNVSAVSSPAFTLNIAADLPPATSTLVITDDNGTTPVELSNGANSNDSTPVLTGAANEGDVITIHDGATVLGSVTVGNTGQWSFTPTLADGAHGIYITTVNSVGNPGATSPTVNFTIDTGVPLAATNLSAANNNDGITVPIADNGITNDSTPRLAGLAEANGIVTVYDGNTVIGSTVANASGEWTFTAPTLSQGGHVLSVTVTDAAGNVGPRSDVVNLTVDTLAPNASTLVVNNDETGAVVPNGGATNDNTPTLSGTAEVGSVITIYDGTTLLGSVAAGAGGDWNFTTAVLGDGSHALSVRVTDAAGNTSVASSTATVIVDTAAPAAVSGLAAANNNGSSPVAIAAGGTTNDSTPALSGTAEAGSIVKIFDGANQIGSVTAGSNGAWSFTSPTLADGLHTLTVTATDAAGNVSPDASISLTVITAAPTPVTNLLVSDNVGATTGNLSNGASTDDNTPTLSGTATAGNVVIISEGSTVLGSAVAGSNGAWSFTTAALSDGTHPLSVTVRDAAGNTSTATNFTVNVDTVAPANATLLVTNDTNGTTVPNGGSTNDSTPTLSGTAEAGSRVSVYDGTTLLGTATAGSGGAWSFTTDVLTQGAHALSVTVTDAAGNVSGSTSATVNIDTVAPVAITGLAAANNNGSTPVAINAGGSTNDNTPALSGSAEAGSLVIIRDGTAIIGSVTAGSNGSWSFTTPTLADGAHTLNVTATDAAGNVSPNAAFALTIDTVAPSPVTNLVINDNVGTIQGPLANGAVTDDATPTLSGTAEANAIVTIYDGSTVLGSVTAGAGGAWTFTTATLSNGVHPLSVTVKDAAGNTSAATTPVSITVDTVAPTASTLVITNDVTNTTVPSGGATNDTTPTLSGVAEAGSRVTIYDGAAPLGTAIAGSDGSWTFTTGVLTTGPHPLSVTVTDAAGNVSGTTSASVIIDTTPPAAVTNLVAANNNGSTAVTIPNNGVTNDSTPLLTGSGEIGAKISVYDGTTLLGTTTVGSNGTWSFVSTALSNGTHTLNVTATDAAGNVSPTTSTTLSIDTVAPNPVTNLVITDDVGTIQGPLANGASTDDATPTLSGTAEANAIVTVYDGTTVLGSVTAGSTGAWTFTTATLSNGTHPLSVTVTDAAGNTSAASATVSIIVDTVAPAASTLVITNDVTGTVVPSGGATNDTTPTLSGSAEVGSRVSIFDGSTLLGTVTVGSGGTWSFTTGTLAQGTHPLSVTVTDAAGNVSGTTAASVTIDTVAPAAVTSLVAANNNGSTAIAIPNNGATNDSTPLLTGNGEVGARISVYDGTTLLGTTTVGSNGSWSFISTPLSNGTHTLNVTATDAAGNVSPNASTTLRVDTVAPAASSLTITDDAGSTPVTLVNGAYTRDTTPVLNGTAEVGAIVTIYDGTTALGSVTVGAGGTWTYTTTALANGAHPLSVTVTDAAGNVSTGNTAVTVNVDTVPPAAVSGLAINDAGTTVTGSGEVGAIVTVRDAGGNALGTATVGTGGTWSVSLSTAQTTGASLSVIQTDRAGNVSTSSPLTGAIRIVAANDVNEVDYTTQTGTLNNGTTSVSHTALLTVGLGNVLQASVLTNGNAYLFNVGPDDTRTVTLNGSISSVGLLTNYSLNLYEQQSNGTWLLINSTTNYLGAVLSLGTLKGANVTYNNLGTGNYAVIVASTVNVSLLPTSTISTVSDITTLAVTVAATVTGNLLTNDTSSLAGTIPNGTAVTAVSGNVVAATGNTVINTTYGTLTIDSHGNYTYALKAGLNIDTLPTADTFTYSVRDASGALTSASLTVNLHNGASATSLLAANSLFADTTSGDHDASGSIYGSSTASHTGTLSITNEHGDITTVHSVGTTAIAGDFGVLSIAANGSYTYALNAGVDGQSLTHKEVFSYTLAANDGTITSQSFTIELHPTITGTAGADTLTGGAYDDTITSGAGADTLVYHLLASADATGGNGHDTWTDFNVAQGDKIDVSNLLIGWNDSTSNINDFVKVDHTSDGNTVLSIDRDGTGTGYSATQLITLEGVNVSLEELLQQPHQNHTV